MSDRNNDLFWQEYPTIKVYLKATSSHTKSQYIMYALVTPVNNIDHVTIHVHTSLSLFSHLLIVGYQHGTCLIYNTWIKVYKMYLFAFTCLGFSYAAISPAYFALHKEAKVLMVRYLPYHHIINSCVITAISLFVYHMLKYVGSSMFIYCKSKQLLKPKQQLLISHNIMYFILMLLTVFLKQTISYY